MITIENADKALKEYYLLAVSAQLNDNISPFFSAIEKNTTGVVGKDVRMTVVRGNADSVYACAEDAALPAPYKNRYLEIAAPLKNIYGTIEVSDKALRASRDSSGAFVNLVNAEMEGLISSAKFNFQRMLYGDGDGTLCSVHSVSGAVVTADVVKDWFKGMCVDVLGESGDVISGNIGLHIISVDRAAGTVTLSAAPTGTFTGGRIILHNAEGNELTGLNAIFNADTLYGYDKEDEPYFAPYQVEFDEDDVLTEERLTDILDYMEENFNSKINMILCSYATRKKIAALIAGNMRVVNTIDAHTGIGVVTVNEVPVHADRFCPDGVIYFVNTEDFTLSQLCDWEWLEDEDGKILKQVPGKAAYSATLVKYAELICKRPCAQAVLKNV